MLGLQDELALAKTVVQVPSQRTSGFSSVLAILWQRSCPFSYIDVESQPTSELLYPFHVSCRDNDFTLCVLVPRQGLDAHRLATEPNSSTAVEPISRIYPACGHRQVGYIYDLDGRAPPSLEHDREPCLQTESPGRCPLGWSTIRRSSQPRHSGASAEG